MPDLGPRQRATVRGKDRRPREYGDGSITWRKDGRWQIVVPVEMPDGSTKRHYEYVRGSEREARQRHREILTDRDQGRLAAQRPADWTVTELLAYWLSQRESGWDVNTRDNQRRHARLHIVPYLGHLKLSELTPKHIQDWLLTLQQQGWQRRTYPVSRPDEPPPARALSRIYVANIRQLFVGALDLAVDLEILSRNPATRIKPPKERPRPRVGPFTLEETARFLQHVQGHYLYPAWLLAATLGLRKGELLGLLWSDIDWDRGELRITGQLQRQPGVGLVRDPETKTPAGQRTLPLSPELLAILRDHQKRQAETRLSEYVFVGPRSGKPIHPGRVNRIYDRLLAEAGLPHKRLHLLRHATSSGLASLGVHDSVRQDILGHARVETTNEVYTHSTEADRRRAVEALVKRLMGG